MAVTCEMCGRPNRSKKDRFCPEHEALMLRRMAASGYLQPIPSDTERRRPSAREDLRQTKFGPD